MLNGTRRGPKSLIRSPNLGTLRQSESISASITKEERLFQYHTSRCLKDSVAYVLYAEIQKLRLINMERCSHCRMIMITVTANIEAYYAIIVTSY